MHLSRAAVNHYFHIISYILSNNPQIRFSIRVRKSEKGQPQFPRAQLDVFKLVVLSDRPSETKEIFNFWIDFLSVASLWACNTLFSQRSKSYKQNRDLLTEILLHWWSKKALLNDDDDVIFKIDPVNVSLSNQNQDKGTAVDKFKLRHHFILFSSSTPSIKTS